MSRLLPRSLLSLLMIWQLLASVLAHPLPVAMAGHADMNRVVASAMQSDCPHHPQASMTSVPADHTDTGHSCHSGCKCPCAGTPALMFVLPTLPAALPEHPLDNINFQSLPLAPVATLLRPPIA